MAINCKLGQEAQREIRTTVAAELTQMLRKGTPFELKSFIKNVYDEIKEDFGHEIAIDAARLTPIFIKQVINNDTQLLKTLIKDRGLVESDITNLIFEVEEDGGAEYMEDYLGTSESVADILEILNEDQDFRTEEEIDKEKAEKMAEGTAPPTRPALTFTGSTGQVPSVREEEGEFQAYAPTLLSDLGQEALSMKKNDPNYNVPDKQQSIYYKVKRAIIKGLGLADYDSSLMDFQSKGPMFLKAVSLSEIAKGDRKPGTLSDAQLKSGVAMMLVDKNGKPMRFDAEGNVADVGTLMYYNLRRANKKEIYDKDGNIKLTKNDRKRAESLAAMKNITVAEAETTIKREIKLIESIRNYIKEDANNSITFKINGGSLGYSPFDWNVHTPISDITFDSPDEFDPVTVISNFEVPGLLEGETYFILDSLHGNPIVAERPALKDTPYGEFLTSLLIDDVVDKFGVPITNQRKRKILNDYINTEEGNFRFYPDTGDVLLYTERLKTNTSEQREIARKKLTEHFSVLSPVRRITTDQINDRRKISSTTPRDQWKLNDILVYTDKDGGKTYRVIEYAKIHTAKSLISGKLQDIKAMDRLDDGTVRMITEPVSYKEFIKKHYTVHHTLNGQDKIVRLNAYMTFEPMVEELSKIEAEDYAESIITKSQANKPRPQSLTDEFNDDPIAKLIQEHRDNTKLHKNLDRKVDEMKATSTQMKEAEEWYKNHPLSEHFPLKVLMKMVNQKGSAVASWSMAGITLYKGADFSDVYHEAWHAFTQAYLTKEQKKELYSEARKKKGTFKDHHNNLVSFAFATELQLEEYLAEEFRTYMLSGGKNIKNAPVRNNIFQKILNALKALFEGVTVTQMALDERANVKIKELYDKLRVGNLTEYTHSAENVQFGELNQGIQPFDAESDMQYQLDYENSQGIVNMIDALVSEWADVLNAIPGVTDEEALRIAALKDQVANGELKGAELKEAKNTIEGLKAKSTYKYTSTLFNTQEDTKRTYKYVKVRMAQLHNELEAKREAATTGTEKAQFDKTIRDIWYALVHFGDVENFSNNATDDSNNVKGVMAYHAKKSRYIIEEIVDLFFAEDNMSETDLMVKGRQAMYDKSGNEVSSLELASREIVYLLHGLFEVNEDTGEIGQDNFGAPKLAPFTEVWNRLARSLSNKPGPEAMEAALLAEAEDYPPFKQLLNKLGPLSTLSTTETDLWSKFWQTFNLTRVPLMQMTVEKVVDDKGNVTYESKIGEASADHKRIGRDWQSQFASVIPSNTKGDPGYYMKNDDEGNYLDVKRVIEDFPFSALSNNVWEFYNAIGIKLSDKDVIRKGLEDKEIIKSAIFYLKRLYVFRGKDAKGDEGWKIRSMADLNKDLEMPKSKQKKELKKGEKAKVIPYLIPSTPGVEKFYVYGEGQGKIYKTLMELEARYSNTLNNFMVTNAEGNTQFEHSQNNTLTITVNAINYAKSYQDLIDMPHMAHLDIERNPFAKASIWLNSIFHMDANDPVLFGQKREVNGEEVKLRLNNLSGVMLEQEGKDTTEGVASAKADKFAKLIMDFHLNTEEHLPELMRHSDKGTSFSVSLTKIFPLNGEGSNQYIDNVTFLDEPSSYNGAAANLLIPHINAELQRIRIMEQMYAKPDGPFDFRYMERGLKFTAFDDILLDKTKELILEQDDLIEYLDTATPESNALKAKIVQDLSNYFAEQTDTVVKLMVGNEFISDSLVDKIEGTARNHLLQFDDAKTKKALINSYVYNSFIHNVESLSIIYGDLAQYNHIKEEFHKRNAGAGSTGRIFRTDAAMKNYVNKIRGRKYSEAYGGENGYKDFDGTMETAIIQDSEVGSVYHKEYAKATGNKEADPYAKGNMNEADAQGYISFDSYRILKTAQGAWSDEHEELYKDIVNGREYDSTKVSVFFSSYKVQYFGALKTEGLPVTALHKFNLFPLIPTAIKNTKLEKLHEKMMAEGIDYTLFESGSKVGTLTNPYVLDENGNPTTELNVDAEGNFLRDEGYDKDRKLSEVPFTKNTIFLEYLKDQLEIAPKYKNKVIFSTQMRKLIEDGLMENGVPTDFMVGKKADDRIAAWDKLGKAKDGEAKRIAKSDRYRKLKRYERNIRRLTQLKKEELLRDINWKETKDGVTGNISDLLKFVQKELTRQDLADHEIRFLDTVKGKMQHDVSLSLSADKIERLLNALVTKRLVKQKVTGEGLIQISGAMFENIADDEGRNYSNPTDEDKRKYGTNDLPTYHEGADGKTVAMKVKVALQGDFKKLLKAKDKDGNEIGSIERLNALLKDEDWLNMDDNRRMITMVGVRIPVQGLNSMEFMEVYEFLPTEAGNIIIPPAEIVAKTGSDFDVDKLTVMMPNLAVLNGTTKLIKELNTGKSYETLQDDVRSIKKKIQSVRKEFTKKFNDIAFEKEAAETFKNDWYPQKKDVDTKLDYFLDLQAELNTKPEKTIEDKERLERATSAIKALEAKLDLLETQFTAFFSELENAKIHEISAEQKQALNPFYEELAEAQNLLHGAGEKAIENNLIDDIRGILELPENFSSLVRPNNIDILEPLAEELGPLVMDFNPKDTITGETRTEMVNGKEKEVISPTRVLEVHYNLYKHASNKVGKETLGLGAVDNTYNVVFNRIGARMEPTAGTTTTEFERINAQIKAGREKDLSKADFKKWKKYHRQKLFLPHHTITVGDEQAISLSHTMDAEGVHKISDVINQMINGWVDVAANAWIFNIQGNKEVSPTLLFMIQAGVPIKHAVYLSSMPMVREYVEEMQIAKSIFAEPLGKAPSNPNFFQNKARAEILSNPKYGFNMKKKDLDPKVIGKTINNEAKDKIKGKVLTDGHLSSTKMKTVITKFAKEQVEDKVHKYSEFERAAFLHFLEIENMGKAVRDVKLRMNVDTSRSGTLFEAQNRTMMIEELKDDARIPHTIVDDILNDSPIGSFYIQPFQLEVWGELFELRNHEKVNEVLYDLMSSSEGKTIINETFGNNEQFANAFRNDLPSFIFQNAVRSFDINKMDSYRGYITNSTTPIETVTSLEHGALVVDGVLYFDRNRLKKDYALKGYTGGQYIRQGLSTVSSMAFDTPGQYYNFVFERAYLRSTLPYSEIKDSTEYRQKRNVVAVELKPREKETKAKFADRISKVAYENYLRDKALDNTFNHWKIFQSDDNFAQQFLQLRQTYDALGKKYSIINQLSSNSKQGLDMQNLKLDVTSMNTDEMNVYHENLMKLSNPNEKKVPDPVDNKRISDFFKRFSIVALLQSGLDTKSQFSMVRIVPQKAYLDIMAKPVKKFVTHLDWAVKKNITPQILLEFIEQFHKVNNVSERAVRIRGKNYMKDQNVELTLDDSIELLKKHKVGMPWLRINAAQAKELTENTKKPWKGASDFIYKGIQYFVSLSEDVSETTISEIAPDPTTNKESGQQDIDGTRIHGGNDLAYTYVEKYPKKTFIYNKAFNGMGGIRDHQFQETQAKNTIGITTLKNYSGLDMNIKDDRKDGVAVVNPQAKEAIDNAIEEIHKHLRTGQSLVFMKEGYGQAMIGADPQKASMPNAAKATATKTFIYLSDQLYQNFGYVNPNMLNHADGRTIVQKGRDGNSQPATDEMVQNLMNVCKTQ